MNFAAIQFFDDGSDVRARHKRIAIAMAVSLALHALLLNAYRTSSAPAERAPEPQPPRSITVRIRPLPPPPASVPRPAQESAKPTAEPGAKRERTPPPRRIIAVPKQADRPAEPERSIVEQPEQAEPESPARHFDIDAARRMARQLAGQSDPVKAGTAVGQFPEKPLETESRAARAIAGAKRRACKDGLPGGLLGPLIILMDKKDSGCKW